MRPILNTLITLIFIANTSFSQKTDIQIIREYLVKDALINQGCNSLKYRKTLELVPLCLISANAQTSGDFGLLSSCIEYHCLGLGIA